MEDSPIQAEMENRREMEKEKVVEVISGIIELDYVVQENIARKYEGKRFGERNRELLQLRENIWSTGVEILPREIKEKTVLIRNAFNKADEVSAYIQVQALKAKFLTDDNFNYIGDRRLLFSLYSALHGGLMKNHTYLEFKSSIDIFIDLLREPDNENIFFKFASEFGYAVQQNLTKGEDSLPYPFQHYFDQIRSSHEKASGAQFGPRQNFFDMTPPREKQGNITLSRKKILGVILYSSYPILPTI